MLLRCVEFSEFVLKYEYPKKTLPLVGICAWAALDKKQLTTAIATTLPTRLNFVGSIP
jgi:hypothetical protein